MNEEQYSSAQSAFLKRLVIVEVVIFAAVVVLGLVVGWRSTNDYANALFLAGSVIVVLGLMRTVSVNKLERDFKVHYARTVGQEGVQGSSRYVVKESESSFMLAARMAIYGLVPIIASIVLYALAQ